MLEPESVGMSELVRGMVSTVDFADRAFPFSRGGADAVLVRSLARVGLCQPPLLLPDGRGLRIVSGRRRLEALRQLAAERGEDLEFLYRPVAGEDEGDLFLRTLWENRALREFNLGESAEIYLAAGRCLSRERIERELFPALGIAPRSRLRRRIELTAGLVPELQQLAAAGRLEGEVVELLAAWSPDDQAAVGEFAHRLPVNRNRLREIIVRLDDLARRDRRLPGGWLAAAGEAAAGCAGAAAVEKVRNFLRERLYPHLSAAEAGFAADRERLGLPPGVRLEPPPFFEGDDFRLSFTFTSAAEWRRICHRLNEIDPDLINELCRPR